MSFTLQENRSSVWMEHSYARARMCNGEDNIDGKINDMRGLLVRQIPHCPDCHPAMNPTESLDIEAIDPEAVPPSILSYDDSDEDNESDFVTDDDETSDWEEKILLLAPSSSHQRLATAILKILHSLRLARLATAPGAARVDVTRTHARQLRRVFAPFWGGEEPSDEQPVPWIHSVLNTNLPRVFALLYNKLVSELRRMVPRLCKRLTTERLPAPARDPPLLFGTGPRVEPASNRPLLIWIPSGHDRLDERWECRLRILLPVHRIPTPILVCSGVEAWCTGVVGAIRTALSALEAQTPHSILALGGVGAGAALALQLAGGVGSGAPRPLLLLAPPLLTAEGSRDTPDDPIADTPHPILFVVGQNAMQSNACTASNIVERRRAAGRRARLIVAGGADDLLRLKTRTRQHLRLPQHAFDAAIAEECARWIYEILEGDSAPPAKRMRPLSPVTLSVASTTMYQEPIQCLLVLLIHRLSYQVTKITDERNNSMVRCVRGVLTRGRGGTPVSYPLSRRRTTQAVPPPASAATPVTSIDLTGQEILDLPIVFADDDNEMTSDVLGTSPATVPLQPKPQVSIVTPKEQKYTKVIVAKRASGGGSAPGARPIIVRSGSSVRLIKKLHT
ncbi:KAT8 regulatory NSL complex subunit 3 [Eumeta japonica]|uniref:KAT8 regulatory NSL complex subunit 3 n=1 Tax=Eumeta variegata TaxID=151549 RepID=A0A4C1T9F1_EUMVA|nr:KAT8 regulatory NSL complex subunit 3 [Eumeta japonica]